MDGGPWRKLPELPLGIPQLFGGESSSSSSFWNDFWLNVAAKPVRTDFRLWSSFQHKQINQETTRVCYYNNISLRKRSADLVHPAELFNLRKCLISHIFCSQIVRAAFGSRAFQHTAPAVWNDDRIYGNCCYHTKYSCFG